jgi:hypothetical protein
LPDKTFRDRGAFARHEIVSSGGSIAGADGSSHFEHSQLAAPAQPLIGTWAISEQNSILGRTGIPLEGYLVNDGV